MLPKSYRLPSSEIKDVKSRGKRISSPELQLVYRTSDQPISRFAVIVPVRLDKRATARNRMKRLIREAIRKRLPQIKSGIDGVIIARKKIESLEEVEKGIEGLLLRIQ